MKYLKYSLFVILIMSAASCDEDSFSSVKTIDFPEHESKLAVTAHLTAKSNTSPIAYVSHSLGIVENKEYEEINEATVELFKDGNLLSTFDYNQDTKKYYANSNNADSLTEGTYTMEVSAPGYEKIKATQVMPKSAEIISSTYEPEKVNFDFYGDLYDLFTVKIKDPAGEKNYYAFDVRFETKDANGTIHSRDSYASTDDPLVEYGYHYEIIPDDSFDGQNHDLRLLIYPYWSSNEEEIISATAIIYTLSEDLYRYEISRQLNQDAEYNPFTEPILIQSNFDNGGYGVFTLKNVVEYTFVF